MLQLYLKNSDDDVTEDIYMANFYTAEHEMPHATHLTYVEPFAED